MAGSPIPQALLDDGGVVGSWVHDHWAGRLTLSGALPGLLGLDPATAAGGVPVQSFLEQTHPEDRLRIESYLHAVAETDGPMEAEFRTRDARGGARTLLIRGRIGRDPAGGTPQSRGIAIDRTEEQAANLAHAGRAANRMAEHALALRGLARGLRRPGLTRHIERLMVEIGVELARTLPEPEDEPRH